LDLLTNQRSITDGKSKYLAGNQWFDDMDEAKLVAFDHIWPPIKDQELIDDSDEGFDDD
jgi:hypothetical protein